VTSAGDDPIIRQLRDKISDNDLKLVEILNQRLTLVGRLWRYKAEHGIEMYSPEREERMLSFLSKANAGPLSTQALQDVYRTIVQTTKDEAGRLLNE
jgi:chorismate mutase